MASAKVTDNTQQVALNLRQRAALFVRFMADEIVRSAEPKTPKKTGRLRRDVIKQALGNKAKIVWGKRYAAIQETKQFRNYTTPGTGPKYAEKGVKEGISRAGNVMRKVGLI